MCSTADPFGSTSQPHRAWGPEVLEWARPSGSLPVRDRPHARIVAVVVAFEPEPAALYSALSALEPQVAKLVIFDNSIRDLQTVDRVAKEFSAQVLKTGTNEGLARGLNVSIAYALANYTPDWVLLLDQDSRPSSCAVELAIHELSQRHDEQNVGILSLAYEPCRESRLGLCTVPNVVNSGMLIRAAVFNTAKFREDFFTDQFGSRGRVRGRTIDYEPEVRMKWIVRNATILLFERRLTWVNYLGQVGPNVVHLAQVRGLPKGLGSAVRVLIDGSTDALRHFLTADPGGLS